jgi:hypothetical protein
MRLVFGREFPAALLNAPFLKPRECARRLRQNSGQGLALAGAFSFRPSRRLLHLLKLPGLLDMDCLFFLARIVHATRLLRGQEPQRHTMSKMNFAYNPPEAAKPEVRLPLLTVGYLVLGAITVWMVAKPYLGV